MTRFAPAPGTHRHRVQTAIERARRGALIHDTDVAGRYLAGVATFGDRDGARALALVEDASRRVRGIAFCVAPLACDDAQATEALRRAWGVRGERRLLRRMARRARTAAIDAFLDGLAADGELRDLVDDLPFGSEGCVRRHLAHAIARPSARCWRGLALAHPGVLAELLAARWREAAREGDAVTRQLTARYHPRLAERVPDAALALAELLLARGIDPGTAVWTELVRQRTDAAVELAIRFQSVLPAGVLAARVRALSPALLARVVGHAPALLGAFGPEVRRMTADRQQALAEAWRDAAARFPDHGAYLLRYLPDDDRRDAAYARWSVAARDRDGVIASALLAALPIELAAREARRHVRDVVALAIDPARRLAGIARYLPWDELQPALADQLGHPEGAMRALALGELLANPGVYPDDVALPARALELVVARKFEQDPVRQAMLSALERWPRRVWRAEHLPAVAQVVRDALDAADLSTGTTAVAQRLIARLFGVDGAWAARWLATTIKERGALYDPNLGARLSDADVRIAAPHLLEIARTWTTQERAPWLIAFATGLGPRLALVDGLPELIVRARDATPYEWVAGQLAEVLARWDPARHAATLDDAVARFRQRDWHGAIFGLARLDGVVGRQAARARSRRRPVLAPALAAALAAIARARDPRYAPTALALLRARDPETFDRVVAGVVADDASVAAVADVQRWIHRHRQDLLAPYLDARPIRGRWATGKTRWVLVFPGGGFFRWTPAQVERHAAALDAVIRDPKRDIPAVIAALVTLPELEYAAMDRLCARVDDDRPAVREKAVRVLARCDAGQGVPTLLALLDDARARFAIYGLRRALFGMVPERALALLRDAPMHKVTVAKEVVRLTGELRARGAFARLEELAAGRLHRDVRIALLRALWDHLDREPTWVLFDRAVADPDWVVASRLADIPADRLTAALDTRLAALLARVIARPEPEARIGLLERAAGTTQLDARSGKLRRVGGLALVDRERALLAACAARLRSPFDAEVRAALGAVLARATEADLPAVAAALDALRADPRALHVAAAALSGHDVASRASWRAIARALQDVALRDPRWGEVAVDAAAARGDAAELVAVIAELGERGTLDYDAAVAAHAAVRSIRDDDLDAATDALAASPHAAVRRAAVAALAHAARPGRGWTAPRLALLARLRADPSPAVAGAAARLWPPREQDPAGG